MARTGNFGRSPRSAPSLTNTIIAIAREAQQRRDSNIMDAWSKGGTFEGKKVTDNLVLKYWKDRAGGVSKDDPLHDTYQNAVTNLDYTIHESKMTAAYALSHRTPADDAKMVHFYLGWAKKIPKDSEFYRVLQRDAGQYMRTVKTSNKAALAAAKEKAYQDAQARTAKQGAAAEFLTDTLRRLNQSGYANGGLVATIEAPDASSGSVGQDLLSFDANDPETAMKLLGLIAPNHVPEDPRYGQPGTVGEPGHLPNDAVLYHSDTIKNGKAKPVTGSMIVDQLTKLDPHFKPGQPIDVAYLTGLLNRQSVSLQEQIDRATKTGHVTDAAHLTKQKGYIGALTRTVSSMPIEAKYMDLHDQWDKARKDPNISPQARTKAWSDYTQSLYDLAKDPRIATNDNMRSRITAEANGKTNVPTLFDSFTGLDVNMDGFRSADSEESQGAITQDREQMDAVTKSAELHPSDPNKMVWTYGKTGDDHLFHPDPNGTEIGAASVADVHASGVMAQTVTVDDPRGGAPMTMVVTAVPVFGTAKDPVTGKDIPKQNNAPIAYAYNFPQGGQNTVKYGYLVKDPADASKSVMNFSSDDNPPWKDDLPVSASASGGNHYEVDFSSYLPQTADPSTPGVANLAIDKTKAGAVALPNGLSGVNVVDVGNPTAANLHPEGTITFNPYTLARSSDIERGGLGQTDPATDFTSLTVANLMGTEDGRNIMRSLDQNPAFAAQVQNDVNAYAGVQYDPKTGGVIPGTGDPAKMSQAQTQADMAKNAQSYMDFVGAAATKWSRLTTGSPYPDTAAVSGLPNPIDKGPSAQKLAADLVRGTSFDAISQNFHSGTLTSKPAPTGQDLDKSEFLINNAKAITVPGLPKQVSVVTQSTTTTGAQGGAVSAQKPVAAPKQQTPSYGYGGGQGPRAL